MAPTLKDMATNKYVSFTTFTKAGERKSTPVWIVDTGTVTGFTTQSVSWKLKRLRNNPSCELQPCSAKGDVKPDSPVLKATARQASPAEYQEIRAAVRKKYPVSSRSLGAIDWASQRVGKPAMADTAIVITSA